MIFPMESQDLELTGTQNHLFYDDDLDLPRELESLRSVLMKTQDKFLGQWLGSSYRKMIQENKLRHQANLTKLTDELETLKENLEKLKTQKENVKKANCEAANQVEAKERELKIVQSEMDQLLQEKERTEKHIKAVTDELAKQKQIIENKSVTLEESNTQLERELELFRDRLGLQFKKISGERLQVVFTSIDDKDPTQPFCFCVKINQDRSYTVSDCEPEVPDLEELTAKLQATNNFRSFIIIMRQRFQGLVS